MKEFKKHTQLGRIKLTKNDLEEFIALMNHSSKEKDHFYISTELPDSKISERDLESFMQHKELPKILDNITISMSLAWDNFAEKKNAYLSLDNISNSLSVDGSDQTWVLGKHKQLMDYIKLKRPFLWFISGFLRIGIRGAIIGVIAVELFTTIFRCYKNGLYTINPMLILVMTTSILLYYSIAKIKDTVIIIQETKSFWEKNEVVITITLSFLTLLATIIFGIIQLNKK